MNYLNLVEFYLNLSSREIVIFSLPKQTARATPVFARTNMLSSRLTLPILR